ncbi:MAG: UTP--glucose-1-phosphate uridylyltransferase [Candidatus Doudnabacteria bacterium RIFCSPLOWO2_02_FULL_42_9]|uniref:UTP--glucose-1-phosphate uridylyltransferase n=1 Tax=Candidatus Doudnabacteria bacterium RIFCSPHIGHO2_01_FULL_41_86 TaxID=1817821 RepID=A0A1F5N908_9BACT|nr:MAG: UTP--glucose-1-phosphate uridylyltransferase [Candidatus Doudnabacteria bacterium RIFCSPHIGHO2_01_FULL_41_86]OGE75192.1 MAG: UTP--glucose-1-phosphate uridylyltransferase [Candidatus Doudnabacteria bacterium RIFCSPHIGHO2_01_43_10]OGE86448.1 MAG: UTP--glucose-1-phosphate uridylyltransferase [Candidatus Doudnabacteria bacterium RIFCSPHIGHO2_12_FULL_42_22]OGE87447.1 MAG: UTP--glucose-1-phosphate uridylyltransferase [Candidatus Doudnabacteria bacterium RIFCSPHIGHO2_02_FULL_42_25]OGE92745.1 M
MINAKKVRKAVIPAAGFGTRFLPATKAQPKEMLPIVDKPVIQYVVEQAVAAGIEQIVIVTGWHKRAIEDHFDRHFELEARLEKDGKIEQLQSIKKISDLADFVYVRQKEALGNGHAVLMAKDIIGNEPFVVMWGDEFFEADPPSLKQLISVYEQTGSPVIAGIKVDKADVSRYGIGKVTNIKDNLFKLHEIVEKPTPEEAPSNLAVHGNYLFTPDIFDMLKDLKPSKSGEIWQVDAINKLAAQKDVHVLELKNSHYYDCGNKLGYLKAVVEFGLKHDDLRDEFAEYLRNIV